LRWGRAWGTRGARTVTDADERKGGELHAVNRHKGEEGEAADEEAGAAHEKQLVRDVGHDAERKGGGDGDGAERRDEAADLGERKVLFLVQDCGGEADKAPEPAAARVGGRELPVRELRAKFRWARAPPRRARGRTRTG